MLKRSITGFFIFIVLAGFLALRFIDVRFFDLFIYIIAVMGSFELCKAFGDRLTNLSKTCICLFTIVIFPIAVFFTKLLLTSIIILISLFILICIFDEKIDNLEKLTSTFLLLFYPTIALICLVKINDIKTPSLSMFFLLSVFLCSMLTDTFAYLIGCTLKGPKLCPKLSPNKTISGGIGGLIGGIGGAFASYFICTIFKMYPFNYLQPIMLYSFLVVTGIVLGAIDELGDLFESYLKRKIGVKDMSNLLPGHGGILDRIDGLSFVSIFAYAIYLIV